MAFISSTIAVRPALSRPSLKSSSFGARVNTAARAPAARIVMGIEASFEDAMKDYKESFPLFAARGWGPSVKAEIWNGRHAMFGFFLLTVTAYCQGQGLLPDPSITLNAADWGTLVRLGDYTGISLRRAVILIAHVHVLMVSIAAAIAPFSFQDKLLLEPGEEDAKPAGLIPPLNFGFTKEAEIWNSRVAMLGIIVLVCQSVATRTPVLDVLNLWLGKLLF